MLRGGYCGKPFKLMPRNDYDNWQAKQVYGDNRPTEPGHLGSSVEPDRQDGIRRQGLGDLRLHQFGVHPHLRCGVALRAEIPIVNSASTDPTIPETYIPWYFTDLQDDRMQA